MREGADAYRETHRLSAQQQRVVNALVSCRTAALGGFKSHCNHCGAETIQYASCRNRHCPKCQTLAQTRWVERQCADLLNIAHWHVVFTLPHELNPIAQGNPALIYRLLFNAASKTLLEFGRNPRWLGGELGITMVLHTWGQNLRPAHPCPLHRHRRRLEPRPGALADSAPARIPLPQDRPLEGLPWQVSRVLTAAHRCGELRMPGDDGLDDTRAFESLKTSLQSNDWVVYTKAPFAGAANVVAYLGRYTHKTAIANHRLVDFDGEHVRFRWRDYAHGNKRKVMRLDAGEFVRRFLLHVLPRRFTRLRHYGVLANRGRARNLALCRALLDQPAAEPREPETSQAMMLRLTGIDITVCRHCGVGTLSRILILAPQFRAPMPVSRGRPP